MRLQTLLRRTLLGVLCLFLAGLAVGQLDLCSDWPARPPRLLEVARGSGPMRAGAAEVPLTPPLPIPVAGYGPPRPQAKSVEVPLHARALVVESEGVKVGLVSLDLLTLPTELAQAVRSAVAALELDAVFIAATHSHSSMGGYDDDWLVQVAGTGDFSPAAREALVVGARSALEAADRTLVPVRMESAQETLVHLAAPRSGVAADERFSRLRFRTPEGAPVGQVLIFAAHPTLIGQERTSLHPDFPGLLSTREKVAGQGVTLVLQGAVGNASAVVFEPYGPGAPAGYVERLEEALNRLVSKPVERAGVAFARAEVALPRPDLSRAVPFGLSRPAESVLCRDAGQTLELGLLELGPVRLLAVPAEVSWGSALELERELGGGRVLSLVDGYVGYVEPGDVVERKEGESRRQYFAQDLLPRLVEGTAVLTEALRR